MVEEESVAAGTAAVVGARRFEVDSVEATWRVAADLATLLVPGTVVALHGELGSGKTTFVQGLGAALGIKRLITSPTFTVCSEYRCERFTFVHFDLYRLTGPDDLLVTGYLEYIEDGAVVVVEWPERAGDLIPTDALQVYFTLGAEPESRVIEVCDGTQR